MNTVSKPSSSHAPDLDWSQVGETVLMLKLAVAQIELSLRSGDESVSSLADSFTTMADKVKKIKATVSDSSAADNNASIMAQCDEVSEQMHNAIIAFQFYDKLTQRLSHLSHSMSDMAQHIIKPELLYSPHAWRELQEKIKSKYSVQADEYMFDAILKGHSVEDALQARREQEIRVTNDTNENDVELF